MAVFLRLAALVAFVPFLAVVAAPAASDCTGTISSLDDVDAAVKCTTVNINSFTVPAGKTFDLKLADSTTVNLSASRYSYLIGFTCRGGCWSSHA